MSSPRGPLDPGSGRYHPSVGRVGEIIRRARYDAGISQRELARRASTAQSAISRLERGHISPTVETLERILAAAGSELVLNLRKGSTHGSDES